MKTTMLETPPTARLVSLDVFRGLVIAAMILVTDPGTYTHTFSQLRHAEWAGATATDMIFPSFLFMVGVAIPFAFAARSAVGSSRANQAAHALRRSLIMLLLGIVLNAFPLFHWSTVRLPGILQRIAVCYLVCALLYLFLPRARRTVVIATLAFVILAVYWALLTLVNVPGIGAGHLDSYGNLPAYIDRMVFGLNHLWPYGLTPGRGVTYDPEGLLSTLLALFTPFLGILVGDWVRGARPDRIKVYGLTVAGLALTLAGWLLSPLLPLNKRILTSTFALFSTGIAMLAFTAVYLVVDLYRLRRGTTPFLVLGTNAILAFTLSTVLTILLALPFSVHGATDCPSYWSYRHLFLPWLTPNLASLAYAIMIVALNMLLIWPLYRKRVFLRL